MKTKDIKNLSQLISQIKLYSVGVGYLYFHVVLTEFRMEAILAVILLSVMNVVSRSSTRLSLQNCSHQMACIKTIVRSYNTIQ